MGNRQSKTCPLRPAAIADNISWRFLAKVKELPKSPYTSTDHINTQKLVNEIANDLRDLSFDPYLVTKDVTDDIAGKTIHALESRAQNDTNCKDGFPEAWKDVFLAKLQRRMWEVIEELRVKKLRRAAKLEENPVDDVGVRRWGS